MLLSTFSIVCSAYNQYFFEFYYKCDLCDKRFKPTLDIEFNKFCHLSLIVKKNLLWIVT